MRARKYIHNLILFSIIFASIRSESDTLTDNTKSTPVNSTATFEYNCKDESNCSFNGKCGNTTHCECNEYFTTHPEFSINNTQCNYKQFSKKTVFLLSFFLGPTGMDHLTIGNYNLAFPKLIFPFVLIITGTIVFISGKKNLNSSAIVIGKILEFTSSILIICWWLIDWILFITNYHKDQYNIGLYNDL